MSSTIFKKVVALIIMIMLSAPCLMGSPRNEQSLNREPARKVPLLKPELKARIRTTAGHGCCWNPSDQNPLAEIIVAFFDMDVIEVKNFGTTPSSKGTFTVEWYDLYKKQAVKKSYDLGKIGPGEEKVLIFSFMYMIARKDEGIKLSIRYSDDSGKSYNYKKVIKTCPDSY